MTPKREVVIFHMPGCASCRAAGHFFSTRGFEVRWHDVSQSMAAKREMLAKAPGNRSVPVICFGELVKIGWQPEFWRGLLEENR